LRIELNTLLAVGDPLKPAGPRAAWLKKRDELRGRGRDGLSPTDAAELGVVQWRLRDADAAVTTLRAASNRDPRNFWVLTHLGSVYQATGQYREASSSLDAARDLLPEPWPGGAPTAGEWFKKAEAYQLKLVRLRLATESSRPGGRRQPGADVDDLFAVRFSGPDGQYTPGTVGDADRQKLPADAVALVQQLLLWFPEDTRLMWLLGELYNAGGDLESAAKVLDDCVWQRRYESPVLREHRRLVQEAYDAQKATASSGEQPPRPVLLPNTWQAYAVGIGFGVILLVLAYFQIGQIRRRRRGTVPPST
jgi:predicted Zn-dependent protease